MKLNEIHNLPKGYRPRGDAERVFDAWYDEHPWALSDTREKFPDYQDREREQAVDHIMDQLKDYVNDVVIPGISKDEAWRGKVIVALRKEVEDSLGN